MKLSLLHESFIDKARKPMSFGKLPIEPLTSGAAIIPVDRWETVDSPKRLRKKFKFMSNSDRNMFVSELFEYEEKVGHHGVITIDESEVILDLRTKDIDQITELDKEYSKYADILFKDIVYSSKVEDDI